MGNQWHFDDDTYLAMVREEVADFDELQHLLADATEHVNAQRILDLGAGTGVTAAAVRALHPDAELVGVDASDEMLDHARALLPDATFVVGRLEDPLPGGPYDLVVSAFAVHHLDGDGKADLFHRIARCLRPGGRFVLCDVVVPTAPVRDAIPLDDEIDRPNTLDDQLGWLRAAGLDPSVLLERGDRVVVTADRPRPEEVPA